MLALLAVATLGPPLLILVANVLQSHGPDGPLGVVTLLVRVVVAGVLVATVYTAVSLGISSLTDRRAIASAGILLTIVGTSAVTGVLVNGVGVGEWLFMFDLTHGAVRARQPDLRRAGHRRRRHRAADRRQPRLGRARRRHDLVALPPHRGDPMSWPAPDATAAPPPARRAVLPPSR